MSLIDSHVHLYPPEVNRDPAGWATAQREPHWRALSTRRRRDGRPVQTFPGVDTLLRAMDMAGVARAVLLGWYWEQPETCAAQNRFYATCLRAHPDRLSAFATIHPAAGVAETLAEVRRAHDEGLRGLGELSPHSQHFACDDPALREALALAAELKMPVNLHVTDPEGRAYPGRVPTPLTDFTLLAGACPRTTFVLAHWGGLLPLRDPAARMLANVYYDTAASPLLYGADIWTRFFEVVESDRVMFGSDYPLNLYPRDGTEPGFERLLAEVGRAGLTGPACAALLGGNAARVLGI